MSCQHPDGVNVNNSHFDGQNKQVVFLFTSQKNLESLGEKKYNNTRLSSHCSHSICCSPKFPIVFLQLDWNTVENFYLTLFLHTLKSLHLLMYFCSKAFNFSSIFWTSCFHSSRTMASEKCTQLYFKTIRPAARKGHGSIAHEAKLNGLLTITLGPCRL